MQDPEYKLTPAEMQVQEALARLRPAGPALSRDSLMFEAGRAAGRRRARQMHAAWAAAAVAAFALGAAVQPWQVAPAPPAPGPSIAREAPARAGDASARPAADVPALPPSVATSSFLGGEYLRLRQAVLSAGPDALPALAHPGPGSSAAPAPPGRAGRSF